MVAPETLAEWLGRAPFSLALSSGWFGFFAHTGMLSALESAGLRPERLSGSSAGALVAAAWGSGLDAAGLRGELVALRREHFWDPGPGPGLLRGRMFRRRLESLLQPTFDRCPVSVGVSAHDILLGRPRSLSEGDLPRAVHASCAVPFMFHPVFIDHRPHIDGGVSDRPGLVPLPRGNRVLFHHLASRSPWRRRGSSGLVPPARAGLVSLVIAGLGRSGPYRLERGPAIHDSARESTLRALERPVSAGRVRVQT